MTVQTQMQKAIASAQSVEASLMQFSIETQEQQTKSMFQKLAKQQKNIITLLEGRYHQILQEEPQFNQR
jgi:protein-tyrosine-phosphatase